MSATTDKLLLTLKNWASTFFTIRNVLTFLMFVVVATALWFGHAMNTIRERTIEVHIEYEGIPEEYSFDRPLPDHVKVRLRDVGHRLSAYSDIFARPIVFDLTEQAALRNGELHLTADQLRPRINDLLQGTTRLQEMTPEVINATYHINARKQVQVVFLGQLTAQRQYELTSAPVLNPSSVSIFGPQEQLDTIDHVTTEAVNLDDVKDTLSLIVNVTPIEGLQISPQQVRLTAIAERFTEKVLTLPVQTKGVPQGQVMRLFPANVEVRVKVAMKDYNNLSDNSISAYVNYSEHNSNRKVDVHLKTSSSNLQIVRTYPTSVEYIIEQQ